MLELGCVSDSWHAPRVRENRPRNSDKRQYGTGSCVVSAYFRDFLLVPGATGVEHESNRMFQVARGARQYLDLL